jgi:hypothetical protein
MIEWLALPIQWNVARLQAALVASASIMDDTLDWLWKTKLVLQTLACYNDIIVNATQCHLNEAETSIKRLIKHNSANAATLEKQHGRLVALVLRVKKVKEDGTSMVELLPKEVDDVKGCHKVSTAMTTLDKNIGIVWTRSICVWIHSSSVPPRLPRRMCRPLHCWIQLRNHNRLQLLLRQLVQFRLRIRFRLRIQLWLLA